MSAYLKEIESLHPAVREMHEEVHAELVAREKQEESYRYNVTRACLSAIEYLADAARAPRVAEEGLANALRAVREAQHYNHLIIDLGD